MRYILVYHVNDYPEMGGGFHYEEFNIVEDLDQRVEDVMTQGHDIHAAGELKRFTYKTVEVVKKVVREDQ